jgi:lipoyl(octanoyl) transferase
MINVANRTLHSRWLGRVAYVDALRLQEEIVSHKIASANATDELLLLEHDPVYTIGRTRDQTSLGATSTLPHPVVEINRGGQATYHGPGQLVGYPIIDLRERNRDLGRYLRALEETLIVALKTYEISAQRREKFTGVWVAQRKIASIGVGVRHWITMHGFALNVTGDLSPFSNIVPCGIAGVEMTSIERETGAAVAVQGVAEVVAQCFNDRFEELIVIASAGRNLAADD